MLEKIKPKSEFARNVITLMTGTTIAQAIPVAISPILTRIYTPEDFGVFSLYMSVAMLVSIVATGSYEYAIILPKSEAESRHVVFLCILMASVVCILSLLVILAFNAELTALFDNPEISNWLYFIPVAVLFTGLFNAFKFYSVRSKKYKDISLATVQKSLGLSIVQIFVGLVHKGAFGLVIGHIASTILSNLRLAKNFFFNSAGPSKSSLREMLAVGKRYKNFLIFTSCANAMNVLSQQVISLLIPTFYSLQTLGFYALAQRVVGLPTAIIGGSIGQVYMQTAADEIKSSGRARNSFIGTLKKLLIIGAGLFTALYFLVGELFIFVFGADWAVAADYIQILIPFYFVRFVSSVLSSTLVIYEKQRVELSINVILLTTTIFLFYIVSGGFEDFLHLFCPVMFVIYSLFVMYYFFLSSKNKIVVNE